MYLLKNWPFYGQVGHKYNHVSEKELYNIISTLEKF